MSLLNGKWIGNIFVQEQPSGTVNGVNDTFTLTSNPIFTQACIVFLNGVFLTQGVHYTISGNTITFTAPPDTGQQLAAFYIRSI